MGLRECTDGGWATCCHACTLNPAAALLPPTRHHGAPTPAGPPHLAATGGRARPGCLHNLAGAGQRAARRAPASAARPLAADDTVQPHGGPICLGRRFDQHAAERAPGAGVVGLSPQGVHRVWWCAGTCVRCVATTRLLHLLAVAGCTAAACSDRTTAAAAGARAPARPHLSRPHPAAERASPALPHAGTLKGSGADRAAMLGMPGGRTPGPGTHTLRAAEAAHKGAQGGRHSAATFSRYAAPAFKAASGMLNSRCKVEGGRRVQYQFRRTNPRAS